jgi:hypothetical protein
VKVAFGSSLPHVTRIEIKSVGSVPTNYIDAEAIGLQAFVDGEYFQYFTATIAGVHKATVLNVHPADGDALVRRAMAGVAFQRVVATVGSALMTGTLPTRDRSEAVELRLDPHEVRRAMDDPASLPPSVDEGDVIGQAEL